MHPYHKYENDFKYFHFTVIDYIINLKIFDDFLYNFLLFKEL